MVLASIPAGFVRHTLGAISADLSPSPASEIACLNVAGQALCNAWPWNWLRRQAVPLALRAFQNWIDLPSDFRSLLSIKPQGGLLSSIQEASLDKIEEYRSDASPVTDPLGFYYAVEDALPENWNLLAATESFTEAAVWATSNVTVTPGATASPVGATNGTQLATSVGVTDFIAQDVPDSLLLNAQVHVFSIHLKAGTATTTDILIEQQGPSATPEVSSRAPRTLARVTWAAGVGSIAIVSASTRGDGAHFVGIESIGDGWYRAWVALTYDAPDQARPTDEVRCAILPGTSGGGGTVFAWGAQLERSDLVDEAFMRPRGYRQNGGVTVVQTFGEPVRRLAIWPTPTEDRYGAFSLTYRRRWKTVLAESNVIEIPDWFEPLYFEACVLVARGLHEEDEAHLHERIEGLRGSRLFRDATDQDSSGQRSFGPIRNTAAGTRMVGRDWTRGRIVNPPT